MSKVGKQRTIERELLWSICAVRRFLSIDKPDNYNFYQLFRRNFLSKKHLCRARHIRSCTVYAPCFVRLWSDFSRSWVGVESDMSRRWCGGMVGYYALRQWFLGGFKTGEARRETEKPLIFHVSPLLSRVCFYLFRSCTTYFLSRRRAAGGGWWVAWRRRRGCWVA